MLNKVLNFLVLIDKYYLSDPLLMFLSSKPELEKVINTEERN